MESKETQTALMLGWQVRFWVVGRSQEHQAGPLQLRNRGGEVLSLDPTSFGFLGLFSFGFSFGFMSGCLPGYRVGIPSASLSQQ